MGYPSDRWDFNMPPVVFSKMTKNNKVIKKVTVNAFGPRVDAKIYSWIRNGRRTVGPEEGAKIILDKQLATVKALKKAGVIVKINSVVIPGVNSDHIEKIAEKMGEMEVDIFNCNQKELQLFQKTV